MCPQISHLSDIQWSLWNKLFYSCSYKNHQQKLSTSATNGDGEMWKEKYLEGRVDDSIPNKECCFNLGQERPRIHQESVWRGWSGGSLCFTLWISCVFEGVEISEGYSYLSRRNWGGWCVSRYVCHTCEQVWRDFLLAGVTLETWKKLVVQWELMALCLYFPHFHSLQFFIFLFTSMACPAEEMLSCWTRSRACPGFAAWLKGGFKAILKIQWIAWNFLQTIKSDKL